MGLIKAQSRSAREPKKIVFENKRTSGIVGLEEEVKGEAKSASFSGVATVSLVSSANGDKEETGQSIESTQMTSAI